jgi:hypothetical protein
MITNIYAFSTNAWRLYISEVAITSVYSIYRSAGMGQGLRTAVFLSWYADLVSTQEAPKYTSVLLYGKSFLDLAGQKGKNSQKREI